MRVLRSGRSLSEPPLKTLISSPEPFTPSSTNQLPNTSADAGAASPVINSRRRRSPRLANSVSWSTTVAAVVGVVKKRRSFMVSVNGCSSCVREEQCLQLPSRSRISRRRLCAGSDLVEQEEEVVASFKESGLVDGVEDKVQIMGGEVEELFKARESTPRYESMNAEGLVRDADRLMEGAGEKKGGTYHSAQKEVGYMSLRSGSIVSKIKIGDECVDSLLVSKNVDRFSSREVKVMDVLSPRCGWIENSVDKTIIGVGGIVSEGSRSGICTKEKKAHDGLIDEENGKDNNMTEICLGANGIDDGVGKHFVDGDELFDKSEIGFCSRDDKGMGQLVLEDPMLIGGPEFDLNDHPIHVGPHEKTPIPDYLKYPRRSRRYSREEKGKEKLALKELETIDGEQIAAPESEFSNVNGFGKQKTANSQIKTASRRETARNIAIQLAPQFAFFKAEEEKFAEDLETDDSTPNANEEEDWPGPVSTAMKIIEERESMLRARSLHYFSQEGGKAEVKIPWAPSNERWTIALENLAPSLKDLCLKVLCENAEEIESLEGLPAAIKHNIAIRLCHSRRMSSHVLGLLTKGSPLEIFLTDCSWATERQFEEGFSQCNVDNLEALQLDFCGRCLPDYALHSTLAKTPNCLPSLNRLSLKGAYGLSDGGLSAIVASAPLLRSLNLSQCSLITSKGIIALAEKLEPFLQELYLDVCDNVDALLILPSLKKLRCLEVLSVAYMESVTDKFLKNLIPISGPKMRGLNVSGCRKLTNASMKTIGESCPHLSFLDIRYLNRLNDSGIQHLANGCCPFQKLKLCHGAFSDEALATFVEATGATLVELVLNNIEKVAGNTALAISRRCTLSLRSLDLSFCRKMTDEALGLIVDSCSNLRILKLFGCTQVTNVFLEGHSNSLVQIIGLKGSILYAVQVLDFS